MIVPQTPAAAIALEIVPYQDLRRDPMVISRLVYETLPKFYELIPGDRDQKLAVILAQLNGVKTELSATWVALVGGEIAGYITFFLGDELPARQFNGAMVALSKLSSSEAVAYLAALKEHKSGYQPLPANCLYLARLAVLPQFAGSGIAARLMLFGMDPFKEGRYAAYIVRENVCSQKFTAKLGFRKSIHSGDAETGLYVKGVPEHLSES